MTDPHLKKIRKSREEEKAERKERQESDKRNEDEQKARRNPHCFISKSLSSTGPRTQKTFEAWMRETQEKLRLWLEEASRRAYDKTVAAEIEKFTKKSSADWKKYELLCDIQTGEIYDPVQREALQNHLERERTERHRIHRLNHSFAKSMDLMVARSAWEDFLYFQNVWNRRFGWNKLEDTTWYFETESEKREMENMKKKVKELQKERDQETERSSNKEKPEKGPRGPHKAHQSDRDYPSGDGETDEHDERFVNDLLTDYRDWINHVIAVFRRFKLGYRQRMPDAVGPEEAHRYSQPIRNSTPTITLDYSERKVHLEERFPRQRRVPYIPGNIEEIHTNPYSHDILEYAEPAQLVPNIFQIDEKKFEEIRESYERKTPHSCMESLRKKGHVHHHACRERSSDWPTSYESSEWGDQLAIVGVKHGYKFEREENPTESPSTQGRYKIDSDGKPIPKLDNRRRYKLKSTFLPGQVFHHERNADGTVVGRDRNGDWCGTVVDGIVTNEDFELDENQCRILLESDKVPKTDFSITIVAGKKGAATRRTRHRSENVEGQLSENENPDLVPSDQNWANSGNLKPNQPEDPDPNQPDDPNPNQSDGNGGEVVDIPSDSDDVKSSSDGDLFKRSYQAAFQRRKARAMLQRMGAGPGEYPHITLDYLAEVLRLGLPQQFLEDDIRTQLEIWRSRQLEQQ